MQSFGCHAVEYGIDMTLIVADTAAGRVARVDSTVSAQIARPLGKGESLRTHVTLPTSPTPRGVPPHHRFRAYYEVYGLPGGTAYSTELRIDRVRGGIARAVRGMFGGNDSIRLRFTDEAAGRDGTQREIRLIDSALDPGRYRRR